MSNVVTLHTHNRWKAVIEYEHQNGPIKIEHYFEEIADLHLIIEHGPDWNTLTRCTVTLNRPDGGAEQNSEEKSLKEERTWRAGGNMSNFYSSQIDAIIEDPALSNEEKIARLVVIESQARDLQRAASSSTADNSGDTDDDVTKVTRALARLRALANERK